MSEKRVLTFTCDEKGESVINVENQVINEPHQYKIGNLVEILKDEVLSIVGFEDDLYVGLRLFIVGLTHNEFGQPTYNLSIYKSLNEDMKRATEKMNKYTDSNHYEYSKAKEYLDYLSTQQLVGVNEESLKKIK